MKMLEIISKDFFKTAVIVWIFLVLLELSNTGMVQRFINLEIYFYFLILLYIFNKVTTK